MDHVRQQIMLATLNNVPFDGWGRDALYAGAQEAGYDQAMAMRAFPSGAAAAIKLWGAWCDTEMTKTLENLPDWQETGVTARITAAVRTRLMINSQHREAVRRALSWYAMPLNIPLGVQATFRTVNAMWYAAGDKSADWNYYSKRGLLATIYTATVLYWLSDTPDDDGDDQGDYPQTWDFLSRRLKNLGTISQLPGKIRSAACGSR
jgi:ubiquinone biosynthesis protein COQ9